ncbi:hypothetical protein KAR91_14025 [Candidatus Pacearchaeota archaeon]|nr:hypothetical protein [Candidatus Pacearchaeota archaeon]
MSTWAIYAIMAGAAFGLSAVPIRYVSSRNYLSAPSELIFMFSSIGGLLGAGIYLISTDRVGQGLLIQGNMRVAIIASGAGLISSMGSLFVIKALSYPESSVSHVMATVNTNALFALGFGIILLREIPFGTDIYRVIVGSILIIVGAYLICR